MSRSPPTTGLLVGQGKLLSRLEHGRARREARGADDRDEHAVDVIGYGKVDCCLGSEGACAAVGKILQRRIAVAALIGHGDALDVEFPCGGDEFGHPAMRGEGDDLKLVGMLAAHIERLRAYGSGAAEDGDALAAVFTARCCKAHRTPPM